MNAWPPPTTAPLTTAPPITPVLVYKYMGWRFYSDGTVIAGGKRTKVIDVTFSGGHTYKGRPATLVTIITEHGATTIKQGPVLSFQKLVNAAVVAKQAAARS